jgi:NitT/TauT family transport system permease protein
MIDLFRKIAVGAFFLLMWELSARYADMPLLFPTLTDTVKALVAAIMASGDASLLRYVGETAKTLFSGFLIGSLIASILTVLAINTKVGEDALSLITGGFAPLPAVAIFPLALMFFGISYKSLLFIAAFATVFPVALAMNQGFRTVSPTLRNVGRNLGMGGLELTLKVLIPSALPAILAGLRNGFSNSFRALVAVEMVIGAATGRGGLGWYVVSSKQNLDIPEVYAGIIAIMVIGLLFEALFKWIESNTVRKWGMLS